MIVTYYVLVNINFKQKTKMETKSKKTNGNQALKTFLVMNKLETGEENKDYAKRAKVKEQVIYNLISGRTKRPTLLIAEALVAASNGKLTMKDMGYDDDK